MRRKSKKTTFIRSMAEVKKELMPVVGGMVLRNASAVGTSYLSNKVLNGEKMPEVVKKIKPWAFLIAGATGELFIKNPYLNSVAAGMNTYGFIEALGSVSPSTAEKVGLPITGTNGQMRGIGSDKDEIDAFFQQIANETADEFARENSMRGYDDEPENDGINENIRFEGIAGKEPVVIHM